MKKFIARLLGITPEVGLTGHEVHVNPVTLHHQRRSIGRAARLAQTIEEGRGDEVMAKELENRRLLLKANGVELPETAAQMFALLETH